VEQGEETPATWWIRQASTRVPMRTVLAGFADLFAARPQGARR
jgi:hypothetical protein